MTRRQLLQKTCSFPGAVVASTSVGAGALIGPRPADGRTRSSSPFLVGTDCGSRTARNLRAAIGALIDGRTLEFRATHYGQSYALVLFEALSLEVLPIRGAWFCIVTNPIFGYACYELGFFKSLQLSQAKATPEWDVPKHWLEVIGKAESYIRSLEDGQETGEQVRPADQE